MILIGVVFLAIAGTAAWILFGENMWIKLKEELKEKPKKTTIEE